jgi:hypothetical protein
MVAKPEHAGMKTQCPVCKAVLTIPENRPASVPPVQMVVTPPSLPSGPPPPPAVPPMPPPLPVMYPSQDDFSEADDYFDEMPPQRGRRPMRKRSLLTWVVIGVAGLLVLGGGTFAMLWMFGGSSSEDLALVPGDAQWFAHIRVADILNTDVGRKFLADIRSAPGGDPFAQMREATGLEPTDIDRFTFAAYDMEKEEGWGIAVFKKPVDRTKLYSSVKGAKKEEVTYAGKKYDLLTGGHADERVAVYWLNDRTAVGGPEPGVKRCLDIMSKRPSGAMDEAIKRAKENHSIVLGGIVPPGLANTLGGPGPGPGRRGPMGGAEDPFAEATALLKDIQLGMLTVDYDNVTKIEVAARMSSDASAQKAKAILDGLLGMTKMMALPVLKRQLTRELPQAGEQVFDTIKTALDALKVNQSGSLVSAQLSLDVKGLQDMLAPALKRLGPGMLR